LKIDHHNRPLWIDGRGKLILESFHPLAPRVQAFLITIVEPTSRPTFLHEYRLTTHSLYAAVSVGLIPEDIINTLDLFLRNKIPPNVTEYFTHCGKSYDKVKVVLRNNKYFVATSDPMVLQMLLKDPEIGPCRVQGAEEIIASAPMMAGLAIAGAKDAAGVREAEGLDNSKSNQDQAGRNMTAEEVNTSLNEDGDDDQDVILVFQIKDEKVSSVTQRCFGITLPCARGVRFQE
jgi:DNA excision repair protein ERCC-3